MVGMLIHHDRPLPIPHPAPSPQLQPSVASVGCSEHASTGDKQLLSWRRHCCHSVVIFCASRDGARGTIDAVPVVNSALSTHLHPIRLPAPNSSTSTLNTHGCSGAYFRTVYATSIHVETDRLAAIQTVPLFNIQGSNGSRSGALPDCEDESRSHPWASICKLRLSVKVVVGEGSCAVCL